jgi:predicted adenine nucleotide alpha hydrolase (AANH) superfamily ATPase
VRGRFFNPNIHPFAEYRRRREALEAYRLVLRIAVDYAAEYRPEAYFRLVAFREEDRCRYCYQLRLRETAREARRRNFRFFSTTLLFSIYQKHDLLREVGREVAEEEGVRFYYRDLRPGWEEGRRRYRQSGLFRQRYCGCIYSERERLAGAPRHSRRLQPAKT